MQETACSTFAAVRDQVRFQESGLKIVPVSEGSDLGSAYLSKLPGRVVLKPCRLLLSEANNRSAVAGLIVRSFRLTSAGKHR